MGRVRTWLVATLTVLLGLAGALAAPRTPPAAAAARIAVTLTAAELSGEGADTTVTLTADLVNTTGDDLYTVTARLWRSTAVLRSESAVAAALAGTAVPTGWAGPLARENSAAVTAADVAWAPGETRTVTVSGRLADFGITARDASYWVGVAVEAATTRGGRTTEVGNDRTLVTLPGTGTTAVVSVVELSAPPRQIKENLFVNDDLADDLTGRLSALLDAAARSDWIVDPALVAEVADMADGYRVQGADGSVPGERADVAAAWLARFEALPRARGAAAQFALADLPTSQIAAAASASADGVGLGDMRGVTVLASPSAATLAQAATRGHPVLATGVTASGPQLVDDVTVVPVLRPSEVTAATTWTDTAVHRAAILTARARTEATQVRLLRDTDDLAADATLPAWATRTPLATLLARDPLTVDELATDAGPHPLDGVDARVADLTDGLTAYAEAAPAAGLSGLPDRVRARAASVHWLGDAAGQAAWLDGVDRRAGWQALRTGLTITAIPRFSLAGASGDYPVTVANNLVDPVAIRLVGDSESPQRIDFAGPVEATVAPASSEALLLRAEASGSGVVNAEVHIETVGGRRLGPSESIVVETTNVGLIGWILVISSGAVLVVTTALRIRQVRRQKAGANG